MHVLLSNKMLTLPKQKHALPKNVITPKGRPISSPRTAFQNPSTKTWRAGVSGWQVPHESRCLADRGNWPYLNAYDFCDINGFRPWMFFLLEDCKYTIKMLVLEMISNNWMVPANYKSFKLAQPLKLFSSSTLTEENTLENDQPAGFDPCVNL